MYLYKAKTNEKKKKKKNGVTFFKNYACLSHIIILTQPR